MKSDTNLEIIPHQLNSNELSRLEALVFQMDLNEEGIHKFLTLVNENRLRPMSITWLKALWSIFSIGVGYYSATPLIGPSKDGAALLPLINKLPLSEGQNLTASSTIVFVGLENGYFLNGLYSGKKFDAKDEWEWLLNKKFSFKSLFINLLDTGSVLALSMASSVAYFAISIGIGKPIVLSLAVLAAYSALHWEGGKYLRYHLLASIIPNFTLLCGNEIERKEYQLYQDIGQLQSAYAATLSVARARIEELLQLNEKEQLNKLFDLLEQIDDQQKATSLTLIFGICALVESFPSEITTSLLKKLTQTTGVFSSFAALWGYFLDTSQQFAQLFNVTSKGGKYALGGVMFSPFQTLVSKFSWDTFGSIYDRLSYLKNGTIASWKESDSIGGWLKGIKTAINDKSAWLRILKLPLAFQHNPKTLMSLLLIAYLYDYCSASSSLDLNKTETEEAFVAKTANLIFQIIKYPGIIIAVLFNALPVAPMLSSASNLYNLYLGPKEFKKEVKLDYFIQSQIELAGVTHPERFIQILYELSLQVEEETFRVIFKKTAAELLKNYPNCQSYKELIEDLYNQVQALNHDKSEKAQKKEREAISIKALITIKKNKGKNVSEETHLLNSNQRSLYVIN